MKRVVKANKLLSMDETKAWVILRKSKELFDILDDSSKEFLVEFDIGDDLYDALSNTIKSITYRLDEE